MKKGIVISKCGKRFNSDKEIDNLIKGSKKLSKKFPEDEALKLSEEQAVSIKDEEDLFPDNC